MLASFVDRAIDTTVPPPPIAIGYSDYGSVALPFQLWARSARPGGNAHPDRQVKRPRSCNALVEPGASPSGPNTQVEAG